MIRHLTRDTLNTAVYDSCISKATNSRIYAYSWYLDIVTDKNWDVLVLDDYVAVMPLPKRSKYFINYIFLPPWSQQLGVFSLHKIDGELTKKFIDTIPLKFKLVDVYFNADNTLESTKLNERTNYLLPLNFTYETLNKNYKKGRKSSLKQAIKLNLSIIEDYDHKKIIELFKKNKQEKLATKVDYGSLNKLVEQGLKLNLVLRIGVTNENKQLIGGAIFFINNHRITYLFSAVNTEGRSKQAMSLLLDFVIRKFSNSNSILDFEGSMMTKVALFFRSFGAQREPYFHYKKYTLW